MTLRSSLSRTRVRVLLGLGALLVVAVVVAVAVSGGGGETPSTASAGTSASAGPTSTGSATSGTATSGGATSSPAATAAPTTDPGLPPVPVDELPPSQPPVGLGDQGSAGDGVTGTITGLTAIDAEATGPGNIAGPALRVSLRLTNGSPTAVPLDSVTVTMTHGAEGTPASPVGDPSVIAFGGDLAPGSSADAVYVFSVPADARDVVSVQVSHGVGAPYMVFTGSVD